MPDVAWTEAWMRFFGELTLRATGLLALAFGTAWLLRRASAATRRKLWAGTIVGLLLLPPLSAILPRLPVSLLPARAPAGPLPSLAGPIVDAARAEVFAERRREQPREVRVPVDVAPAFGPSMATPSVRPISVPTSRSWSPRVPRSGAAALALLYFGGLAIALRRLLLARGRAAQVLRAADQTAPPWQLPPDVPSRESDAVALPQTLGSWRSVVLLPRAGRAWPAPWRDAVVAHEVSHVRGRDPLWQLLGELACAIYWFHPLAHLALRQLRIERELAADDATLATGFRPSDYAHVLFELACIPEQPAALGAVVPLLTPGGLKARIRALLEPGRPRRSARGVGLVLATLGLLAVLPLASAVPARRSAPVDPSRRWLLGQVLDPDGRPVAGAEISLRPDGLGLVSTAAYAAAVTVRSDDDGWFHYPDGVARESTFGLFARKGTLAMRKGILAMKYGTSLPTTLRLRPAQTLTGTVRDDTGRPVEGATVRILEDRSFTPGPGPQVLARSGRDGRWRIEGMLYGDFLLIVQAPWGVAAAATASIEDRDVAGLDTVLARTWPVTGRMTDKKGRPLAGARLEQSHTWITGWPPGEASRSLPGERYLDWDESAADGTFRLLPLGRMVRVEARDAEGNEIYDEFHGAGPSIQGLRRGRALPVPEPRPDTTVVRMVRGGKVAGSVRTPDGRPVPDALVTGWRTMGSAQRHYPVETRADASGRFELPLPGTDFILTARAPDGRQGLQTRVRFQPEAAPTDVLITVPAVTPGP
jgi:hypothetical protein